jgi:hypothetical protein
MTTLEFAKETNSLTSVGLQPSSHSLRAFLDPGRFKAFLRFEFATRRGDYLLPLSLPLGVFLLMRLLALLGGGNVTAFPMTTLELGLLVGVASAVNAYRPEKDPASASFHVMLPVTAAEKFLVRWVLGFGLTFVGVFLGLLVLTFFFSALGWAQGRGAFQAHMPGAKELSMAFTKFLAVHSAFFCGGIFFKGNAFIKTLVSLLTYAFGLYALVGGLILWGATPRGIFQPGGTIPTDIPERIEAAGQAFAFAESATMVGWLIVMPLFLYLAAYFRTVEHEVR